MVNEERLVGQTGQAVTVFQLLLELSLISFDRVVNSIGTSA